MFEHRFTETHDTKTMKAVVYFLRHGEQFYIGSTTRDVFKCMEEHESRGRFGWDWSRVVLEADVFQCETREEMKLREAQHVNQHLGNPNCMNRRRPMLTADQRRAQQQAYRDRLTPEAIQFFKDKRNRKVECSCGRLVSKCNLARHRKVFGCT